VEVTGSDKRTSLLQQGLQRVFRKFGESRTFVNRNEIILSTFARIIIKKISLVINDLCFRRILFFRNISTNSLIFRVF